MTNILLAVEKPIQVVDLIFCTIMVCAMIEWHAHYVDARPEICWVLHVSSTIYMIYIFFLRK